jgi:hypothetical protein
MHLYKIHKFIVKTKKKEKRELFIFFNNRFIGKVVKRMEY